MSLFKAVVCLCFSSVKLIVFSSFTVKKKKMGLFLRRYTLVVFLTKAQRMRFVATSEAVVSSLRLTARCVLKMVPSLALPSSPSK